jgi:hypothetical protein
MTPEQLAEIEAALLCISEARERAERVGRELRREHADEAIVGALETANRDLLGVHGELMRRIYFGEIANLAEQLKLAG